MSSSISQRTKNMCGKKEFFVVIINLKSLNYIMSDCQHGFSSLKRQNMCTKIYLLFLLNIYVVVAAVAIALNIKYNIYI